MRQDLEKAMRMLYDGLKAMLRAHFRVDKEFLALERGRLMVCVERTRDKPSEVQNIRRM